MDYQFKVRNILTRPFRNGEDSYTVVRIEVDENGERIRWSNDFNVVQGMPLPKIYAEVIATLLTSAHAANREAGRYGQPPAEAA